MRENGGTAQGMGPRVNFKEVSTQLCSSEGRSKFILDGYLPISLMRGVDATPNLLVMDVDISNYLHYPVHPSLPLTVGMHAENLASAASDTHPRLLKEQGLISLKLHVEDPCLAPLQKREVQSRRDDYKAKKYEYIALFGAPRIDGNVYHEMLRFSDASHLQWTSHAGFLLRFPSGFTVLVCCFHYLWKAQTVPQRIRTIMSRNGCCIIHTEFKDIESVSQRTRDHQSVWTLTIGPKGSSSSSEPLATIYKSPERYCENGEAETRMLYSFGSNIRS
eukprot:IDg7256t1